MFKHPKVNRRYGVISHYKVCFWVLFVYYKHKKEIIMEFKAYKSLPEAAIQIREAVFVREQGFVNEFDEIDKISHHLVLFDGEQPVATCRYYWSDSRNSYVTGRIAVMKNYRGQHIGSLLLKEAEHQIQMMKGENICLHAQVRVKEFYEKLGYHGEGEESLDEGCPHIWMCKKLETQQ
mgnify:FL=1